MKNKKNKRKWLRAKLRYSLEQADRLGLDYTQTYNKVKRQYNERENKCNKPN